MLSLKAQPTPMISSLCLTHDGSFMVANATLYHSIVGGLFRVLNNHKTRNIFLC